MNRAFTTVLVHCKKSQGVSFIEYFGIFSSSEQHLQEPSDGQVSSRQVVVAEPRTMM